MNDKITIRSQLALYWSTAPALVGYPDSHEQMIEAREALLSGKPDFRGSTHSAAWPAYQAQTYAFETDYLRVKWFKNGNAHIEFRRMDLVEQMNRIIARHYPNVLPPRI